MKILVFDNYDSFTYNLVHLIKKITGSPVEVYRNDEIGLEEVKQYDKIILSPGPGVPKDAGILIPLIKEYASSKSILGVCLGHQAIAEAFGGILENLETVYHGVATSILVTKQTAVPTSLFDNIPDEFVAGRYHSWIVQRQNFPSDLVITAVDEEDRIMALQHKNFDVQGVQFHPESILTPTGETMIANWLKK